MPALWRLGTVPQPLTAIGAARRPAPPRAPTLSVSHHASLALGTVEAGGGRGDSLQRAVDSSAGEPRAVPGDRAHSSGLHG